MSFISDIYGNLRGHIAIVTKDDEGQLSSERWFNWPDDKSFINKYISIRDDEDVYNSVGVFNAEERTRDDHAAMSNVVWADADTCDPSVFRVQPSKIVRTSPDKWHVWWILNSPVLLSDASHVSRLIAAAHKDAGCDNGWHASKILRVPGTTNTKYDTAFKVTEEDTGARYDLADIAAAYGDIDLTPQSTLGSTAPEPVSEERLAELESIMEQAGLGHLYTDKPQAGQSWSERMYRLELDLFRQNLTPQEVFSLMREAPINKYNPENAGEHTATGVLIPRRRNPDAVIWQEIAKAYDEHLATVNVEVEPTSQKTVAPASFLSLDERELVSDNPSWVDRYVAWALTKSPDHAATYSRTLGYMVLSTAFADRFYINLRWGASHPNLWCLILGDSTRTHKSAAKNLFLRCVHAIEAADQCQIDVGSDVTVEALVGELGKRDKLVSLIHTDEVARFFMENMTKNYRAGTMETFTELYDGTVPVVLRATKGSGNRVRAKTRLNFVGVGIRKRVSEILSRSHFESGFLMRMVWSVADPPRYRQGDSDIQLADDVSPTGYDDELIALLNPVLTRRAVIDPEKALCVTLEPDALKRLNRFTHELHVAAADDDTLDAAVDRLRDSVLKAAALLAYLDETDVSEFHVWHAIKQGELWFNDLRRMLGEVSSSSFEHVMTEVNTFIASGENHQRLESAIYRKFGFKPTEFNEVMIGLQKAGYIRRVPNTQQRWETL